MADGPFRLPHARAWGVVIAIFVLSGCQPEADDGVVFDVSVAATVCPPGWEADEDCQRLPITGARVTVSDIGGEVLWEQTTDDKGEVVAEVPVTGEVVVGYSSHLLDETAEHQVQAGQPGDGVSINFLARDIYLLDRDDSQSTD